MHDFWSLLLSFFQVTWGKYDVWIINFIVVIMLSNKVEMLLRWSYTIHQLCSFGGHLWEVFWHPDCGIWQIEFQGTYKFFIDTMKVNLPMSKLLHYLCNIIKRRIVKPNVDDKRSIFPGDCLQMEVISGG